MKFEPRYKITNKIAKALMRIEAARQAVSGLPVSPEVLIRLRDTARLFSTHYSTQIEGNRLTQKEVRDVIKHKGHFPGRERDEAEVTGYYIALDALESYASKAVSITEEVIKNLHALVMSAGKKRVKPTPYRDGQNVIRDGLSGRIIYLPPEAKDVPGLMKELVKWMNKNKDLPCPILAGIVHYQFATIHPYYDGNGRVARLLTTLILYLGGYDLKGIYCLEEYYARNLSAYYHAISIGPSHNYYEGREEAEITPWIEYFCLGMVEAFEKVKFRVEEVASKKGKDKAPLLRTLDVKKRKALELFYEYETITSKQVANLFNFKTRSASGLCKKWVEDGFIVPVDGSRRGRKYKLAPKYAELIEE